MKDFSLLQGGILKNKVGHIIGTIGTSGGTPEQDKKFHTLVLITQKKTYKIKVDLKTILEISRNRAKMIARDQASKINAQLSEDRYTALGFDIYEWSTSQDHRVRSSHAGLNKTLCKYSDPQVYSKDGGKTWKDRGKLYKGKPAEDYQCRCVAIPVLSYEL